MRLAGRILFLLVMLVCVAGLSFRSPSNQLPAMTIFFREQLKGMKASLELLREKASNKKTSSQELQAIFRNSRSSFKRIEFILEYYYELDVKQINGPSIDYYEEEDPTTHYEPTGFQPIEALLFPDFDFDNKEKLISYADKLAELCSGLEQNSSDRTIDPFLYDALMEEFYRLITLGLADFDSPIARESISETKAALEGIDFALRNTSLKPSREMDELLAAISLASQYLEKNNDRDKFNTIEFIVKFLHPACDLLGKLQDPGIFQVNPALKSGLRRIGNLFSISNLSNLTFLGDNKISTEKIALGKKLFFDPALSSTGKRSCASCHQPALAFSDGLPKASNLSGHGSLQRNTPGLWNASLQTRFFHDSRTASLDDLIKEVLSNGQEMNTSSTSAMQTVLLQPDYEQILKDAYPGSSQEQASEKMVNAIGMYIHSLLSYQSRFDAYMRNPSDQLTGSEKSGFNLFMGKGRCGSCHFAPFFNGTKPPLYLYQESEVLGVPEAKNRKRPKIDPDSGRIKSTGRSFHLYSFKTPSLRNISLTAPYMHNGVFNTLEEVLDFYEEGGGKGLGIAPSHQTLPFEKLNLSHKEKKEILAFLHSLTDTSGLAVKQLLQLPVVD